MKTDTLDIVHRIEDQSQSPANPFLVLAKLITIKISRARKAHAQERAILLMETNLGEIPALLLEDIGIDAYQALEIVERRKRQNRVGLCPIFPTRR